MNTAIESTLHGDSAKQNLVQSAETFIAVVLLAVCAVAAATAWFMQLADNGDASQGGGVETVEVLASLADADLADDEGRALNQWQASLARAFSQREQALRQQEQNAVLAEQASALAEAQAAAEAARQSALEAERRAREAELARQRVQDRQRAEQREKAIAAVPEEVKSLPRPGANAERIGASVDWSSCSKPSYPRAAVRLRQEGMVRMLFDIDADGQVIGGRVVESSGFERLDSAALEAIMKCRFEPETLGGIPQAASAEVRFGWRLNG